jgi:hypothetical protein
VRCKTETAGFAPIKKRALLAEVEVAEPPELASV